MNLLTQRHDIHHLQSTCTDTAMASTGGDFVRLEFEMTAKPRHSQICYNTPPPARRTAVPVTRNMACVQINGIGTPYHDDDEELPRTTDPSGISPGDVWF